MTTPSTGDAMGESLPDEVVEAVRDAIFEAMDLMDGLDVPSAEKYARAAIEAYRKALEIENSSAFEESLEYIKGKR